MKFYILNTLHMQDLDALVHKLVTSTVSLPFKVDDNHSLVNRARGLELAQPQDLSHFFSFFYFTCLIVKTVLLVNICQQCF